MADTVLSPWALHQERLKRSFPFDTAMIVAGFPLQQTETHSTVSLLAPQRLQLEICKGQFVQNMFFFPIQVVS